MSDGPTSNSRRSTADAALTVLGIAFVGPALGLALGVFGLVLAPPWTFLTGLVYPVLGCVGIPLAMVAVWARRLRPWGLLATLGLVGIAATLLLTTVAPWVPTGMTSCEPLAASPPQVRYACVSTSSDDTSYRYEFTLEGWANWPVMRVVNQ
jgi:hypothetical protein